METTTQNFLKSRRDALANYLMLDFAETEDYRYQQYRTSQPVWAFENAYYCITKKNQKPAKHRDGLQWEWKEVKDSFTNRNGYLIWKADVIS